MASMNEKDYYKILGVDSDADETTIRKAFQQKARKLHPDVNKEPDAEERFKEVSEAYAVLSDPDKRKRYDAMRRGGTAFNSWQPVNSDHQPSGWPFGGWGSPFPNRSSSSNSHARSYNPKVGADVVYQLDLDKETAAAGCRRGITYNHYATCKACSGKGSVHAEQPETCPTCGGSGRITVDLSDLLGFGVMTMVCPECEGTGRVVVDPCAECGGSGRVLTASEVDIDIPAGSHDGDEIRLPGKGNAGTNGSEAGDFVCRVGVPSERLVPLQAQGFQLVGFCIPFLVVGGIAGVLSSMLFTVLIPLAIGLFMAFGRGIGGHGLIWWRNALRYVLSGMLNGVVFALFLVAMVSCVQTAGTAGMRGMYVW